MKTNRIFIIGLIFGLLLPMVSLAQRDVYNWKISPYAGLLTLNNDIAVPEDANSYAYGLRLERRLGNDFSLGLHLTQLNVYGAAQNNLSGGFVSLGYHWDNGYLFSQRAAVSIFHRLELGYIDQYSNIENIGSNSGDASLGFENGIKFRFGDRVSADVALELLATKESITEGDITQNLRYNIWKVGISYHFGSRKSDFVAPVFVPFGKITVMRKVDRKDDNIWIANDSIYNSQLMKESDTDTLVDSGLTRPQLTRADSLLIFMYFDSLYQRKVPVDSTMSQSDTLLYKEDITAISDTAFAKADSIKVNEVEKSLRDTSYSAVADTLTDQSAVQSAADTVSTTKLNENVQRADTSVKDAEPVVVPTRVDTVYKDREMKADTSAQKLQSETPPSRVDTLYVINDKQAEQAQSSATQKSDSEKNDSKSRDNAGNNQASQQSIDKQNELLAQQNKLIQQNQQEIDNLRRQRGNNQNNKGDAGKIIAAGAAGTALGALVSGGNKKEKPDTVYYESAAAQQKLDSLTLELAALKKQYGITDTIPAGTDTIYADSAYVPDPPIGMYFSNDSTRIDSSFTASQDSTFISSSDSLSEDSLASVNQLLTESDSLDKIGDQEFDQNEAKSDSTIVEGEAQPTVDSNTLDLIGDYPVSCNFGLNKTVLDTTELEKLEPVITDLKSNESLKVLLTGYTDSSGNADYNLQLSKKRAKSVQDYLAAQGISSDRIEIRGSGVLKASDKYSPNARRVEVTVIE